MANLAKAIKHNILIHWVGVCLAYLSGEYLLIKRRYPNGGTVVFLRAAHVTVFVFIGALALFNAMDPRRGGQFSWNEFRMQTVTHVTWIGAIFASAYALLYARFASQWTYLAGMYNEIKAAQCRKDVDLDVIAEWNAGFIEDCDDLHLLRKMIFASTAQEWLKPNQSGRSLVLENLTKHAPGGATRCNRIIGEIDEVVGRVTNSYI